jgi:hypothetical protein
MDSIIEHWLPVPGYEGYYSVSSLGRVRSEGRTVPHRRYGVMKVTERILKPGKNTEGYAFVVLSKGANLRSCTVHQLVATTFIGPRAKGEYTLHGPAGKDCNALCNLSYGTQAQNCGPDRRRDGTDFKGEKSKRAKLKTPDVHFIRSSNESDRILGEKLGVSTKAIRDVRVRRTWTHI